MMKGEKNIMHKINCTTPKLGSLAKGWNCTNCDHPIKDHQDIFNGIKQAYAKTGK